MPEQPIQQTQQPSQPSQPLVTDKPGSVPLTEDRVREIVRDATKNTQVEDVNNNDGTSTYGYQDPYQDPYTANPYQDQYASNPYQDQYARNPNASYTTPTIPPVQSNIDAEVRNITLQNKNIIEKMRFDTELNDMVSSDRELARFRDEAKKMFDKYHKETGNCISAETALDILAGQASRTARRESQALRPNSGGTEIEAGGAAKPKPVEEMTTAEIEEKFGRVPW